MQTDNDPKYSAQTTQKLLKPMWPRQSPDLNLKRAAFQLSEDQTEHRKTHKQAKSEGGSSKGLEKHLQGQNSETADVHVLLISDGHWLQMLSIETLKLWLIYIYLSLSKYFWPPENGGTLHKMAVIPKCQIPYYSETP